MKRTLFALCAVLLALLTAACSNPGGPDGSNDGLVHLTINTGNPTGALALTDDLARGGVDYYEVAFSSGGKVYRASWDYSQIRKNCHSGGRLCRRGQGDSVCRTIERQNPSGRGRGDRC
jgi:hypothetical protein